MAPPRLQRHVQRTEVVGLFVDHAVEQVGAAAGAVGSEIYATHEARVEVEQKSRTQVNAVLVEDAPSVSEARGEVTEPPLTNHGAAVGAIFSALLLWGVVVGGMALLFGLVRFAHMKIRPHTGQRPGSAGTRGTPEPRRWPVCGRSRGEKACGRQELRTNRDLRPRSVVRTRDVMTTDVVVAAPDTPARDAARLLSERGFTALPVVDARGALVGVVGEAELLRNRLPQDSRWLVHGEPVEVRQVPADVVAQVMATPSVTVGPNTDLADVADLMLEHGVRSLPVVHEGRLAGIVTRRDLLRSISRADWVVEAEIRNRLGMVGGAQRWQIAVAGGKVSIVDKAGRADTERHVVDVLVRAVAGVTDVRFTADQVHAGS
ncbi:CBS domain-containing protein [Lentzea terrae]|uniref:CBS domain-containing protein n=1 Tax=Lentzea terrae TaxID=2200761 RepID=UPI000DD3D2F7|nr:CBS domain-containing protein [Lentzea terrae]